MELPEGLTPMLKSAVEAVVVNGWSSVNWPENFNALHLAAQSGHLRAIELLVKAEGDLQARDNQGHQPLDYAMGKYDELANRIRQMMVGPGGKPSTDSQILRGDPEPTRAPRKRVAARSSRNSKYVENA